MKKRILAFGLLAVVAFTLVVLAFALYSCGFKMPKIKKKIPEITSITLSDTDTSFIDTNYQDASASVKSSLTENTPTINEVYKLVNEYRQSLDREILTFDSSLSVIATIRAQEIAKSGKFSHHRPDDKGYFSTLFQEYGFNSGNAGENLAKTYKTAEEAVQAWRESPTHNACILNENWTKTGIGIAQMEDGTYIWVQEFAS